MRIWVQLHGVRGNFDPSEWDKPIFAAKQATVLIWDRLHSEELITSLRIKAPVFNRSLVYLDIFENFDFRFRCSPLIRSNFTRLTTRKELLTRQIATCWKKAPESPQETAKTSPLATPTSSTLLLSPVDSEQPKTYQIGQWKVWIKLYGRLR